MPNNTPEYHRKWRRDHPAAAKAIRRRDRIALRYEALCVYGGSPPCCACCGESHLEFLTVDHVEGGGNEERRRLGNKGGTQFYRWLRQQGWPSGYRVLCWNCNAALGAYGYCPHGTTIASVIRSPRIGHEQGSLFE